MAPPSKLRGQSSATKSAASSTPAWRAKLLARTPTTASTAPSAGAATPPPQQQEAPAATTSADQPFSLAQPATGATELLKPTFVLAPALPKPDVSKPQAPEDPAALLRKLQALRSSAAQLLSSSGESAAAASASTTAATAPGVRLSLASTSTPAAAGRPGAQAAHLQHAAPQRVLQTPGPGRCAQAVAGEAQGAPALGAGLSSPLLAGLRRQENEDTGGGFLTHFGGGAPAAGAGAASGLRTPLGPGGGGGTRALTAGGGAGASTPLSVLKSLHRLQHLQRLRREGSQLVASLGEADGA